MIKAILQDGRIQPLEPLPKDWVDGQELVIEPPESDLQHAHIREWSQELEAAAVQLSAEEHDRFQKALEGIERESKTAVQREWGLP